jgi:RimJ/RimL family protein N-acetyltransferase
MFVSPQREVFHMIRKIVVQDAESYLMLCQQLDRESSFMLLEPGERMISVKVQRKMLKDMLATTNNMIFVAEQEHQLVGHLQAFGGEFNRNRHKIYIVIGILQQFTGKGIGRRLFSEMESWARFIHAHRLELTVMAHNKNAITLYQKLGFEVEGTAKEALLVDGKYIDEIYMAKLI